MTGRTGLLFASAAGFVFFVGSNQVHAATAPMNVQATVQAECAILNVSTLDFGPLDNATDNDALASFDIDCTATANVDVTLNAGTHVNGTTRRLQNDTDLNAYIGYLLYNGDPNSGDIWDAGVSRPFGVDGTNDTTVTVGGRVFNGSIASSPQGSYTDTVTIEVTVSP